MENGVVGYLTADPIYHFNDNADLSASLLQSIHADSLGGTSAEAKTNHFLESPRYVHSLGGTVILCSRDITKLNEGFRSAPFASLNPEGDAAEIAIGLLRDFVKRYEKNHNIAFMDMNRVNVGSLSAIIREDGAIRSSSGWVKLKLSFLQLPVLLDEIRFMLNTNMVKALELLSLASGEFPRRLGYVEVKPEKWKKPTRVDPLEDAPHLDDMPGIRRIRKRLQSLLRRVQGKDGSKSGILLYGPPGTGKTMIARSLAKESGRTFVSGSYAEWQSSGTGHLGDLQKAMRETFKKARECAPALLFIDELDSFQARGSGSSNDSYDRKAVNSFLEEIQGFHGRGDVVLIGATNHKETLDPALIRKGRFGDHVRFPNPDLTDIAEIVDWYLKAADLPLGKEDNVTGKALSRRCFASAGAELRALVDEAIDLANERSVPLNLSHFVEAMVTTTNDGIDDETPDLREKKYETAIHEMGHAVLVHKLFGHRAKIGLITVNPGLNSLGHVVWEFEKGQESRNVTDKAARIVVSLGGRCAEILHGGIGQLGFGASSDLENATRAANLMVVHGVTPTAIDRFVSPKDEAEVRKLGTEWLSYLNGKTIELLEPHVDLIRELAHEIVATGDMEGADFHKRLIDVGIAPGCAINDVLQETLRRIVVVPPVHPHSASGTGVPQMLHHGVSAGDRISR
jgi:predicted AAA+ superfamily ATPase